MKKAKEDDVSPLTKVIVDKIHGGRKQDSKYWEKDVGNSRNDFVGYNNGDIPITQPEAGIAAILKRIKVKRTVFTIGFIITCFFSLVYFRPDLFPFLSYSKIYQTISDFLPDKEKNKDPIKSISKESSTEPREHSFSEDQIIRAKKNVLKARKNKSNLTGIEIPKENSPRHSFKDNKNRYEIQLLSGRYVYTDSVIVTADTITFENKKGLVVSVNRDGIKSLKRLE